MFVAEKSFVVNQNDKKNIEEDSSFHLTCQTLISDHCTEVQNGQFSSGGGILSQLQWYHSDIQKFGFPIYEIKENQSFGLLFFMVYGYLCLEVQLV